VPLKKALTAQPRRDWRGNIEGRGRRNHGGQHGAPCNKNKKDHPSNEADNLRP